MILVFLRDLELEALSSFSTPVSAAIAYHTRQVSTKQLSSAKTAVARVSGANF
jgi:hypothetical protein